MTKKRFEVDKFIEGYPVAQDLIDSYVEELVKEGRDLADVTIDIRDNQRIQINGGGKYITLKECCELLNELWEENERLKKENVELKLTIEELKPFKKAYTTDPVVPLLHEKIGKLIKENEQLKEREAQVKKILDGLKDKEQKV